MIATIALNVLMPVTTAVKQPARLPGPALPVEINQPMRLPGPISHDPVVLPGPAVDEPLRMPPAMDRNMPLAAVQVEIPRPAEKKAPSAIETLRKMVKDDRPIVIKAGFDNVTLPEADLENEIGVPPVRAGR